MPENYPPAPPSLAARQAGETQNSSVTVNCAKRGVWNPSGSP